MIDFDSSKEFSYHFCGKFESPGDDWIHLTRNLEDYELMLVTEGTLYIASDREEYTVHAGEYLLMPPTPYQHGCRQGSASFYWLHFGYDREKQDHTISDSSSEEPGHILLPLQAALPAPDRVIILMKQLMDSDRRYKDETLNRYLTGAILSELHLAIRNAGSSKLRKNTLPAEEIENYISWHILDNLKVKDLAEYFGYNEKYLTTIYRKQTGIPLKQYILHQRMDRACALLSATSLPVSRIAYSLGWGDVHNFAAAFKKLYSMTPSAYRASYPSRNVFQN